MDYKEILKSDLLYSALTILGVSIFGFALYRIMLRFLRDLEKRLEQSKLQSHNPVQAQRVKTIVGLIKQIGGFIIFAFTAVAILNELGVDIKAILAGAGVVGLAVGFGAQSLVRDFFNGFFLIVEDQVAVGDWVSINGKSGHVEILNFRITVLRDLDGATHVIPNGTINQISNYTCKWSAAVLDLPIPPEQGPSQAEAMFHNITNQLRSEPEWETRITSDLEVFGVQDINDRGLLMRVRIKTLPGAQWELGRAFRKKVKEHWDREGWEIPRNGQNFFVFERAKLAS